MKRLLLYGGVAAAVVIVAGRLWWLGNLGLQPAPDTGVTRTDLTKEAVPGHVAALKGADAEVRRKAAVALWQIGAFAKEAVPALLEALNNDPEPPVREAAAKALGTAGEDSPGVV